jgi:hypothetical protein
MTGVNDSARLRMTRIDLAEMRRAMEGEPVA